MAVTSIKIALVICGLATLVATDKTNYKRKEIFNQADTNTDGKLTSDEYYAIFDKLDSDKNGALTISETYVDGKIASFPEKDFIFYDNLDGSNDGLAQRSSIPKLVKIYDTNGDGEVEFEEGLAVLKKILKEEL